MKAFFQIFSVMCLIGLVGQPALAQTADDTAGADFERRLELSRQMHQVRPTRTQVFDAIDSVAERQPPSEREAFRTAMRNILDYRAIENISINAMADTYTAEELEVMLEYYSKPEAKSAAEKDEEYRAQVYPEIIRMLDNAMMRIRTGSP